MVDVNITPLEIETATRHGDVVRVELRPMSLPVRRGERLRLEIRWESSITEAAMTHCYGQKVGTDTCHHDAQHPSRLRLHERPRQAQP